MPTRSLLPRLAVREFAKRACLQADRAVRAATAIVRRSRTTRDQRRFWSRITAEHRAHPSHLIICCAYCARIRADDQTWGAVPRDIGELLHHSADVPVSHGICPDCLGKQFPRPRSPGSLARG